MRRGDVRVVQDLANGPVTPGSCASPLGLQPDKDIPEIKARDCDTVLMEGKTQLIYPVELFNALFKGVAPAFKDFISCILGKFIEPLFICSEGNKASSSSMLDYFAQGSPPEFAYGFFLKYCIDKLFSIFRDPVEIISFLFEPFQNN